MKTLVFTQEKGSARFQRASFRHPCRKASESKAAAKRQQNSFLDVLGILPSTARWQRALPFSDAFSKAF